MKWSDRLRSSGPPQALKYADDFTLPQRQVPSRLLRASALALYWKFDLVTNLKTAKAPGQVQFVFPTLRIHSTLLWCPLGRAEVVFVKLCKSGQGVKS